ncbi:sensor histidine kinase [Streptomyces sp. MI02-7b]|uniref:sensor histidine kinase n=1 Tax=Streptomyces sp. MI02-7b TaxID=462941 RepID=UPI0029BDBAC9|nr:ATP-binding protein [Streptomyces sp. MI02-7b]MDX3075858.1 ATP-binding protein [Streptomyces sp. MI02-7b]
MPAEKGAARRAGIFAGWTTRRWLLVGVSAALVVLMVLGGLGLWAMNRATSITRDLVDTRSPSLTNSIRLETALVNQETGIRGYGLTGQKEFLQPYRQGLADQKTAVSRLHELLAHNPQGRADLREVLTHSQDWQRRIADPIATAPAGAPVPVASDRATEGKAAFDRLRAAMTAQQDHLREDRTSAVRDLTRAEHLRDRVLIAIAVVIVLLAVLIFEGLRRGITGPLSRLGADARTVARGDFARPITATGPADLRHLGTDLESMRRRLADEIASSEQARHQLDEQAADLKRSNVELEQFAHVASHDLQEPLRKVASFTQLLQRRYAGQIDDRADQYIAFAADGATRMQTLINDLLAFSRIGRLHSEHQPTDLDTIVDQALDNLSVSIEESGATITRDPLPELTADPTQLGMLWQNLISNAVKFRHPDRTPAIHLGATPESDQWRFTVTDNGIGIDPEFADHIFVIFHRLHTKDSHPGSGIGLALCKKIVEFHGGTITLDPTHTPGTSITFTLPTIPPTGNPTNTTKHI